MAINSLSKFNTRPSELNPDEAKTVNEKLAEDIKSFIISKAPEEKRAGLESKLKAIPININDAKDKSISALAEAIMNENFSTDSETKNTLSEISGALATENLPVSTLAGLNIPLKDHPSFREEYYRTKTKAFGDLAGLSQATVDKLTSEVADIDDLDEESLNRLVADRAIDENQKKHLSFIISLSRLSNENPDFINALNNGSAAITDFIDYDSNDWKNLLLSKNIPVPAGEVSVDTYAKTLEKNMELSFPQTFFLNRVILKKDFAPAVNKVEAIDKINTLGKINFDGNRIGLDKINWAGINDAEKKSLENDVRELQELANRYSHLGFIDVLADGQTDATAKKSLINEGLNELNRFYQNNAGIDFSFYNFFDKKLPLDYTGISETGRQKVKAQAMAYQRMLALGENATTTISLLSKGFSSSFDITSKGERNFVRDSGLELNEAKKIFVAAQNSVTISAHFLQALRDSQRGGFSALTVNNLGRLVNDLKALEGYAELFGNQDFCDCEHCRSIFSPAAYFTDLMLFVEKNVTKRVFNSLPDHPLNLKNRRPDLWTLLLSCENTTTEIPYLDVVNEVLEGYAATVLSTSNIYRELAVSEISCDLPFHLPLEELRTYLGHFGFSLQQLFDLLQVEKSRGSQEILKLSDKELEIITSIDEAKALARFGNPASLDTIPVSDFIKFAAINREELDQLLQLGSLPEIAQVKIIITEKYDDIQQYEESFQPGTLTGARLDLIHRFLKLYSKTPWSIPEFDSILKALTHINLFSNLENRNNVLLLADLVRIQNELLLTPEELCAITDELPSDLYERLFNQEKIFGKNTATNEFNTTAAYPDDKITPYLLAGLSISEHELTGLFGLLGIDTAQPVNLDKAILSRLYRQSKMASALKLRVNEYASAIPGEIKTINDILALIDRKTWIGTTPFNFQDIDFILNKRENAQNKYRNTKDSVPALINEVKAASAANGPGNIETFKTILTRIFNTSYTELADWLEFATTSIDSSEIKDALTGDIMANPVLIDPIVELLHQLERIAFCFDRLDLETSEISFIIANKTAFGINDLKNWNENDLKSVSTYCFLKNKIKEEDRNGFNEIILRNNPLNALGATDKETLAGCFSCPPAVLNAAINAINLSGTVIAGLNIIYRLVQVSLTLGVNADSLVKLTATDFDKLTEARDLVFGAFAAKYEDEKERNELLAPYHDKINTLKRDALCSYIIARQGDLKFKDRSDLYAIFLLDVEMSGCFRTSKVLAAISSLQLYIQRCLLNIEQSDEELDPGIPDIHVPASSIPVTEWEWRKNYRVWEANRKVFLYPENYLDPSLRNTKTLLFKELEDELLQQQITPDTAEQAYKKYLAQFLELSHLRYAGAYYYAIDHNPINEIAVPINTIGGVTVMAKVTATASMKLNFSDRFIDKEKTAYYLFARTHLQPYQYYYRTYHPYKDAWGDWQKMDIAIEAEEISAIIHNGRLRVYWTESQHKELTTISNGSASSSQVNFKVTVKYSVLDVNNKWSSPQRLFLGNTLTGIQKIADRLQISPYDDNKKDSYIELYKQEVFKKPYVSKTNDSKQLLLRHIYTPGKNIFLQRYKTQAVDKTVYIQFIPVHIVIPSHIFVVNNNQFGQTYGMSIAGGQVSIRLDSAVSATIQYKIAGFTFNLKTGVDPDNPLLEQIWMTNYKQDIYKYVNEPERLFFESPRDAFIQNTVLNKEYLAAYNPEGNFQHFVETGDAEFVRSNRIITQYKTGKADLQITRADDTQTIPLSTILSDELNIRLMESGIERFLSLPTQNMTDEVGQKFDFNGPYGNYYWEMFFHIPFLIASHLNANQDFKGAKWWYERIFDPTAPDDPAAAGPGEHYWRFREFRGLNIEKLNDILNDENCIAVYKSDPFDPDAIARLRITAYQKAIVMKYIDNLVDWGDQLFSQDTQESIVEAESLYILAQQILGKRPERIGKCKENEEELTFENIIANSNDISLLDNVENLYLAVRSVDNIDKAVLRASKYLASVISEQTTALPTPAGIRDLAVLSSATTFAELQPLLTTSAPPVTAGVTANVIKSTRLSDLFYSGIETATILTEADAAGAEPTYDYTDSMPADEIITQARLAFCVPVNEDLLAYWDRIEDRLFKIRNCMNISGIRRKLALFQPPIDPMLLVRAKAAGLSMEEILTETGSAASLPNYRFSYMLEKAKQLAQQVQNFGSLLLSALEKKDVEELTLLRSLHERNIIKLTATIKQKQIDEAEKQYNASAESVANIETQISYYEGLLDEGLTGWEHTQQVSRHGATLLKISEGALHLHAGIAYLFPQAGSPFSLNYGGQQLGTSFKEYADWASSVASVLDSISQSAGLEATFQRRKQEWNFQLKSAQQSLAQANQQLLASEIRLRMAEHELDMHEKATEQAAELDEFYKNKFTGLGLYNYMTSALTRIFRMSYIMALDMAKQAEQCYASEIGGETKLIMADNWQMEYAGLLSGDKLMFQLNQLEQAYMKNYGRSPEITQNFSLALLNPGELMKLKQTGKCSIQIPEIALDMVYPGQYRRLIRGLRLSIPCISGPFTNISAELKLKSSSVRLAPDADATDVLIAKDSFITTSSAINDAGTFEFNLKDERYLPFEYAGAISDWELTLPGKIRTFNYNTISDVIIHLSYTAKQGDREAAENKIISQLTQYAQDNGLFRLVSLKQDFPDEFYRLLQSDPQKVELNITMDYFPYFLQDNQFTITTAKLYLKPKRKVAISTLPSIQINGNINVQWNSAEDLGTDNDKLKGGIIQESGSPIKKWIIDAGTNGLNKNDTEDILLLIKYQIS